MAIANFNYDYKLLPFSFNMYCFPDCGVGSFAQCFALKRKYHVSIISFYILVVYSDTIEWGIILNKL